MSRPYLSVKHVDSMSLLPEKLTRGRAYFIDDEQVIVIDHGLGPVVYGGKPGPQGQAGEPIPQLQDQINYLAQAALNIENVFWDEVKTHRSEIERVFSAMDVKDGHLQEQTDLNAEAILNLTVLLNTKMQEYDNAIATLAATVADLYPANWGAKGGEDNADPLDNETVATDAGVWTVQQTTLRDGTIVLTLDAQELYIDRLKAGDHVDFDGSEWTVTDYSKSADGTITMTIKP